MAQSEKVRAFKNELRNYNYYIRRLIFLDEKIENCYEMLGGVRGIDFTKEPIHSPPNKELEYKIRDDIERYRRLKERTEDKVKYCDEILARMETDVRWAVTSVYVDGKQIRNIALKMYLAHSTLQKRINKAIEEALD